MAIKAISGKIIIDIAKILHHLIMVGKHPHPTNIPNFTTPGLQFFVQALRVCTFLLLRATPHGFRKWCHLTVDLQPLWAIFSGFPIPANNVINWLWSCNYKRDRTQTSGGKKRRATVRSVSIIMAKIVDQQRSRFVEAGLTRPPPKGSDHALWLKMHENSADHFGA